ncbi:MULTISPECIES: AAA family ATPase [Acidithrix]|uniref:ATP-dependent zinc metalloprotease FtsH 4 n=1 Tax=Acidithrix ferrooxidans TaxID=1280514 RepID=A0A0D8HJ09_9ACTN|nr:MULTISPECIES: AAA family ATPase [Acidithrix]KJF17844.1 ATP-dependent zinc metalloprotease FtsH 4 [Acidithrix ferrooxidans]
MVNVTRTIQEAGPWLFVPPTDVDITHKRWRRRRSLIWLGILVPVALLSLARLGTYLWFDNLISFPSIHIGSSPYLIPALLIIVLILVMLLPTLALGRSPHVRFDPSDISVDFGSVKGLAPEVAEIKKTLELFMYRDRFGSEMGGQARRGVLFEGPPGTGKTMMAKAMAKEAGVPFLYASASSFQAMYYGQTNRKIRAYFKSLRTLATRYGGAIGFIDEFDAIGAARRGLGSGSTEGVTGVVSELLVQMQSFEIPSRFARWRASIGRGIPLLARRSPKATYVPNVLMVAATNRASDLDPALVRPGRFDRIISFGLPSRSERMELIDFFLTSRSHDYDLDVELNRERIAAKTSGYSPAMLERLFDEALVVATRYGISVMRYSHIEEALLTVSIGIARVEPYPTSQRVAIATHEAGHAIMTWACGKNRTVEMVSILKRGPALGATLHDGIEESFVETRSELHAMMKISFGGMVAEEVLLGESSSGASGDLINATQIGARCVGTYGMEGLFLSLASTGRPNDDVANVVNDAKARDLLEDLLEKMYAETVAIIKVHRDLVSKVADELLLHEELTKEQLYELLPQGDAEVLDLRES